VTRNSLRIPVAAVTATLLLGALGPMRASGTTLDDKKAQAEQLQQEINSNGDKIAALGEQYNGAVSVLNFRCQAFPHRWVARSMGMRPAPFLS